MKKGYIAIFMFLMIAVCGGCEKSGRLDEKEGQGGDECQETIYDESESLAEGYRNLCEGAEKENTLDSLSLQEKIIKYLGNAGYAAVDKDNQIDMVNHELVEEFCKKAEEKQEAELKLFSVMDAGGFIRYDMHTDGGKLHVIVSQLKWNDHVPKADYFHEFEAYTWKYTEKGYFFIEEYRPSGFDGDPGLTGFRVKPLDLALRELNRKYVLPVGYERNNMLIVDWDEQDHTNLDFYDLYELMYRLKYGADVPYDANYGGTEYEIPKSEFEGVLQTYFAQMDSEDIEKNADYAPEGRTYRYRPRGIYDCEFPYGPYPEVVGYEEQEDGTIKLLVEAVWERKESDLAFSSELVVRPLENGDFQYVSNRVVCQDADAWTKWYRPRLTDEQWLEHYR